MASIYRKYISHCTFLGIIIDERLSWSYHINYVNEQISKNIGMLSRLRHFMSGTVLKLLYNSLILPYLMYCNIVWCSTYPTHLSKLFILQKRSKRINKNSSYNAYANVLFCRLQILNVYNIFKLQLGESCTNILIVIFLIILVNIFS